MATFTLSKKVTDGKFQSILGLVLLLALADKAVWSEMHIHIFSVTVGRLSSHFH